jgi:hypothetical protein
MKKKEFSIMPSNMPYWDNKRFYGSERHEVFEGRTGNRDKSIEDGLVVFLRPELHNARSLGVHFNRELDLELKKEAEKRWLEYYHKDIEDFIKKYGRNYL